MDLKHLSQHSILGYSLRVGESITAVTECTTLYCIHLRICGAVLPDNFQKQWPGDLILHYRPGRALSFLSTSLHSCHPVALLSSRFLVSATTGSAEGQQAYLTAS